MSRLAVVVPESPYSGLDARLVADARIVLVDLEDEVGLARRVEYPPEPLEGERVGGAFEGGNEDRVEPRVAGAEIRGIEGFGGIAPVEGREEGIYRSRARLGRQHVAVREVDAPLPDHFADGSAHGFGQDRVGYPVTADQKTDSLVQFLRDHKPSGP